METFKVSWVTDPGLSEISDINNEVLGLLARFNPTIFTQDDIGNGVVKYKIEVASINNDFINLKPLIMSLIADINYERLQLSVILPDAISDNLFQGLKNILSLQLPQLIMQSIDEINTTVIENDDKKVLILIPQSNNEFIYINPLEIEDIKLSTNLQELIGWDSLTDDLLGLYLLKMQPKELNYNAEIIYRNNILCIKLPTSNFEDYTRYKDGVLKDLQALRNQGYFCIATNRLEGIKLKELTALWPIEFVTNFEFIEEGYVLTQEISSKIWNLFVFNGNNLFNMTPELWMSHSLYFIQNNELPLILIEGPWQSGYKNIDNRVKCQYSAILAYNDCITRNIQLSPFLPMTMVTDDLQIAARFSSYDEVTFFKERFIEYLNQSAIWHITEVAANSSSKSEDAGKILDIDRSVTKRVLIAQQYPYLKPLHVDIFVPSEDGSKLKKFLVVNIGAGSRFIYSPPTVTDDDVKALRDKLIKYYEGRCHEKMDVVLQQDIKDMTIEELMRIIITDDKPNYCFTLDTYSQLLTPLNPATKKPFSLKNLAFATLNRLVFNGLYNVADIPGIIQEIPVPPLVKPLSGELIFRNQADYIIVDVKINDVVTNLLEIMSKEFDKVEEYVSKLWKKGFFQTIWSVNYQLKTGQSSIVVPAYDKILQNASMSYSNGEQAVLYMKRLLE